jgi:hypothetical protein
MYDSLIARLSALGLAGIVSLSLLAGIDRLATHEHAANAMAQGRMTPALMLAASAPETETS